MRRAPSALALLGACVLLTRAAADEPPAREPAPEPYRRAVVLLRDGNRLEADCLEGHRHLRLRLETRALAIPLTLVRQVLPFAAPRGDPPGFAAAGQSLAALTRLLAGLPEPLQNGLLLRGLLGEERAACQEYAVERGRAWLLELVRRGAPGTAEARGAEEALSRARWDHGVITFVMDPPLSVEVDLRLTVHHVEVRLPEGRLRFRRQDLEPVQGLARAPALDPEAEDQLAVALASPEELAAYLESLPAERGAAAALRGLLGEESRGAVIAAAPERLDALLAILVRGAADPLVPAFAADALADRGGLDSLEGTFLADLRGDSARRRRLAQRGLATLHALTPEEERASRSAGWEEALDGAPAALAALWLALGDDARVQASLVDLAPAAQGEALRLVREAGRSFDGEAALGLASSDRLPLETRVAALSALEVSRDLGKAPALATLLSSLEDDAEASAALREAAHGALASLLGLPRTATREELAERASVLEGQYEAAREALERLETEELGLADRLADWDVLCALAAPCREVEVAAAEALDAEERQPEVVEAALAALTRHGGRPDLSARIVRLLDDERTRALALAALGRLHRTSLPPDPAAWARVVNRGGGLTPLGAVLAPARPGG